MNRDSRLKNIFTFSILLFAALLSHASNPQIRYSVSLANPAKHILRIQIDVPPGPDVREFRLPAWYALYQIRDFAQYVNWVRAIDSTGKSLPVAKTEKDRWRISGASTGAEVEYEIFADDAGPFGAQLNSHHAFLNLAEILMYPVDSLASPLSVNFADIPSAWRIATMLPLSNNEMLAKNYEELSDSPVEISAFEERDFDEKGGHYRVIIDADGGNLDTQKIVPLLRKIVIAETSWMEDRPFNTYTFIYHLPKENGGGGMEHANGTAIDLNAKALSADLLPLADITAHEFFHLWNVKRIRPKSLEPVDFTRENYTNALWFSEGVTSTVADYALLRAGLIEQPDYLNRLGAAITELENRPAHLTQSVEESSIDTWLEKYSYYRDPARSISYYNKGELLGVILDLKLREVSAGSKSLRDLFQWMNLNYAKRGQTFPDSEGVLAAAESITHADFKSFFKSYVEGTDEIPWDSFLNTVGLQISKLQVSKPDLGFLAARNFNSALTVTSIEDGSEAQKNGLKPGDEIVEINGETPQGKLEQIVSLLEPGEVVRIKIKNDSGEHELRWKVGTRQEINLRLKML